MSDHQIFTAQKYLCGCCHYKTNNKKDYNKHLTTVKHRMAINDADKIPNFLYICGCGKTYKYNTGFCRHKKSCAVCPPNPSMVDDIDISGLCDNLNKLRENVRCAGDEHEYFADRSDNNQQQQQQQQHRAASQTVDFLNCCSYRSDGSSGSDGPGTNTDMNTSETDVFSDSNKNIISILINETKELKSMVADVIRHGAHTVVTNTNSNNKTFNLQFFLNETCKDAMNIMEFVETVKLQLKDLENIGKHGYINGMSNIIVNNLNSLDVSKRPVHCTDTKRETIYIRDKNEWDRDNVGNPKMRRMINSMSKKNIKLINEWRDIHPDCGSVNSKYSEKYQNLIIETMGGCRAGETFTATEPDAKIIKNVIRQITVGK